MRLLRFFLLISIAACLCTLARAGAADSPASPAATVDLVQQAAREGRAGRWQKTLDAYRAAWAIERRHDIAADLGVVELRMGKMRDAAEHLAYSLSTFPATGTAARRKFLEERLAEARAKVTALSIALNEPGAQILVGGQHAGTSPLLSEVFVEPGMIEVTAKKQGYVPVRMVVLAADGGSQRVVLTLKREPTVSSPPRAVTTPKHSGPPPVKGYEQPLLYSLIGLTGAALATGTALMVAGASAVDDAAVLREKLASTGPSTCAADPPPADCAMLRSHLETGSDLHWAGAGLLIAGGASVAAATVYGLVLLRKTQPRGAMHMIPVLNAQSGTIWIVGNW